MNSSSSNLQPDAGLGGRVNRASSTSACRQKFLSDYDGPVVESENIVLSRHYGDVIDKTAWREDGFCAVDLPGGEKFCTSVYQQIGAYIRRRAEGFGLAVPKEFDLGSYHLLPGLNDAAHIHIARWGVPFDIFGLVREEVSAFVSDRVKRKMSLFFLNESPEIKDMCGVRIIRPQQRDHNPFHRDGWFETLRHAVTLWIPIANCPAGSSLRVFRGSHLWNETDVERTPEGAQIGKKKFKVPALIALRRNDLPIEPVTEPGKALLFSSYLLHGGGENRQNNATRVSMELRFVLDV